MEEEAFSDEWMMRLNRLVDRKEFSPKLLSIARWNAHFQLYYAQDGFIV